MSKAQKVALIGNTRRKGIPHSKESAEKIGIANSCRVVKESTRIKLSAAFKGRVISADQLETMSLNAVKQLQSGNGFKIKYRYVPTKCTNVQVVLCRSKLELEIAQHLDACSSVLEWEFQVVIPYVDKLGNQRHTLPDFLAKLKSCTVLIEAKGRHLIADYIHSEKYLATMIWCLLYDTKFFVAHSSDHVLPVLGSID